MKLVLCCDYGLDDAAATVDVLLHAKEDGYSQIVLVAIGGNVPSGVALRNAKKLVANLPFELPKLTLVDTTDEEQPSEYLKLIHGEDGMGDLFAEKPFAPFSVLRYAEWLGGLKEQFDLLSLGPMTLVPAILKTGLCRRFVFMAGNIAETPNFKGYEFNHALDRAAFAEAVLFPHVAVTMDTCRNPLFNVQEGGVAGEGLLRRIVNRSRELTFVSGEKGCYVWDDIAVKYLRHPAWFSLESATDRDGNRLNVAKYIFGTEYSGILDL